MAAKKTANKPAPSKPVTRGGALSKSPSKPRTDPKVAQQKARDTYLTTVRNLGNLTVGSPEYNAALATVNKTGISSFLLRYLWICSRLARVSGQVCVA